MKPNFEPHCAYRGAAVAVLLMLTVALAGCQKELYGALTESDCNEMIAVLVEGGVDARKTTPDGGKTWTVTVADGQLVRATEVLKEQGMPEKTYDDLGALFKKDGLVSTPTEERVRFMYGVSQELDETLSKIDGVVVARVHIVLPNNDPLAQTVKPSSASVFIKYRADADLDTLTPAIKNLVVHSIEGLTYDEVSVTSLPAEAPTAPPAAVQVTHWGSIGSIFGIVVAMASIAFLMLRDKTAALLDSEGAVKFIRRLKRDSKAPT